MQTLTFVTRNRHKLDVTRKILPDFQIEGVDFEVPEIQSLDPHEIAAEKLRFAYTKVGRPCCVLDVSLFLDCLNGFPGPFIKWYYEKTVGAEKTCEIAKHFDQFGCHYTSVLGYFDGRELHFFDHTNEGTVPTEPRGKNGFHWDVIFIPKGDTRTYAEMTFEEKHSYAAGSKLFMRLAEFIKTGKGGKKR